MSLENWQDRRHLVSEELRVRIAGKIVPEPRCLLVAFEHRTFDQTKHRPVTFIHNVDLALKIGGCHRVDLPGNSSPVKSEIRIGDGHGLNVNEQFAGSGIRVEVVTGGKVAHFFS